MASGLVLDHQPVDPANAASVIDPLDQSPLLVRPSIISGVRLAVFALNRFDMQFGQALFLAVHQKDFTALGDFVFVDDPHPHGRIVVGFFFREH